MKSRWSILALLFAVRATMAFQFQSVAAVSPLLIRDFGVSLADVGLLIGLYFAPGIPLALAGGAIGQKVGDKAVVLVGLALMLAGGLAMALSGSWTIQIVGRLVAGTGGVLINVLMTKMVSDWFAGREISTAMAIFVNSWPFGLAISLLALPPIASSFGTNAVYLAVAALIAGGMLLAQYYQSPAAQQPQVFPSTPLTLQSAIAVTAAGVIWSLYNVGFAMVFSFGPTMLTERGWSVTAAGSAMSLVVWIAAISVPLGGFVADRTGRNDAMLVLGCAMFAAIMFVVSRRDEVTPSLIALGMVSGLAAGPILSLPARVLEPGTRALGMGMFYTVYYLGMMAGTALGGVYAVWYGSAAGAFDFGGGVLLACIVFLWSFHRVTPAGVLTPKADP